MTLEYLVEKIKSNTELTQAFLRVMLSSLIMIVLFFAQFFYTDFFVKVLIASTAYTIFSVLWFLFVYHYEGDYPARRLLGIVCDLGILSYGIDISNIVAASLYPLILWVIIANGYRYGVKYLYVALAVAVVLFQYATYNNASWDRLHELIIMMTVGLIVLPLLFSHLLNQVSTLNQALMKKTEDLEERLYHDGMTKLPNREALQRDLAQYDYDAVVLIDINNFGDFNDLHGMDVGNEILKNVAKYLTKIAYKQHLLVYRLSGDSFILLQKEKIEKEALEAKTERIVERFEICEMSIDSLDIKIKINFTVVMVKAQDKVLEKANMTLHFARKRGEKYWVYDESIDRQDEVENTLFWEKEIYSAIQEDRIVPVFHPIVNAKGEVGKYEVLMRIRSKGKRSVKFYSPIEFLEIAVKTNQYEALTAIMIEKSFAAMADKQCDFSINLTYSNIQNKNMVMFLKEQIDHYQLGDRLILEIVESEEIYNFEIVKTFVAYLRLFGVRFAIDDFGTGYSNYMHVLEVMPEYIKLDGSLIQHIDRDENAHKFVSSIVLLAKNIGVKTIAEFVHSEKIYQIVKSLGVDEFQGSFFSKPITLEELQEKQI